MKYIICGIVMFMIWFVSIIITVDNLGKMMLMHSVIMSIGFMQMIFNRTLGHSSAGNQAYHLNGYNIDNSISECGHIFEGANWLQQQRSQGYSSLFLLYERFPCLLEACPADAPYLTGQTNMAHVFLATRRSIRIVPGRKPDNFARLLFASMVS